MNVEIKRIDKDLPLPVYATKGSVGFDIYCREDTLIRAKDIGLIPGNVSVKTPDGFMLILTLRSSTPIKKGLLKPHGLGIIDNDYCGDEDELKVQVYNFSDQDVVVKKGEKVAQGIFVKIAKAEWEEKENMGESRGGFGSTG